MLNIDPNWSLEEAFQRISAEYRPGSIMGGRARNVLLQMWGEIVGRNRARAELQALINKTGSRNKVSREYSISRPVLDNLESHFNALPADPEPRRGRFAVGDQVGPWTLLRRLGRGGGAEVWRASAREFGEAALKLPGPSRAQQKRFAAERQIMARLAGTPGVMPVIAIAESDDAHDLPWLAMPIAQQISTDVGLDDPAAVLKGLLEVSETLIRLHGLGVSHRDIKPDNMYTFEGHWLLSDFGIASFPGKEAMTSPGQKLGPVYFIAPEMLNHPDTADGLPADVYSFAKTMWVLVSGQKYPLPGEQRIDVEALRISTYVALTNGTQLDELIDECTRHEPRERPTAASVRDRLRHVIG